VGATEPVACSALLIGNSRYQRAPVLANPAQDMALLAPALESAGVKCHVLHDLDYNQMGDAIGNFLKSAEAQRGAVWVSYSGHAVQLDGRNYLLGVDSRFDSEPGIRGQSYNLDELVGRIHQASPRAAVITVDACRNNPFKPAATRGIVATGLAKVEAAGLFVGYSTAPYTKALDGTGSNGSPYARALATALGKRPRSLEEVFRETADAVYHQTNTQQVPEYRSSMRADWWFGPAGIELRGVSTARTATGTTSPQAPTREVGYRPDLPRQALAPEGRDPTDWAAEDYALQRQLAQTDRAEARSLLARGRTTQATPRDRVLAGMLLEAGQSIERDRQGAAKLYRRAAESGYVPAQTLLGELLYARGDWAEAYKWLTLAADRGAARARLNLAQLTLEGRGTPQDIAGAMEQFKSFFQQQMSASPNTLSPEEARRLQKSLPWPPR
jgi:TPR repeat protein